MRRASGQRALELLAAFVALVTTSGCSAPSTVNPYYQHGTYLRRVTPVEVGVLYAEDQRPGWPPTAAMRIFGPTSGAQDMWHTEGDQSISVFVGKAVRSELGATGLKVSSSPDFDRPSGGVEGRALRRSGVDRIVFMRINYFGFVSPLPQLRSLDVGEVLFAGLPAAVGLLVRRNLLEDEGVSLDDDTPAAYAYVDIDLWVVDPASGKIIWADVARSKRSMGAVRGSAAEQIEVFLPEALYVALHETIWRADFLAALGATLLPKEAGSHSYLEHEQNGKKLFTAGRFADAAAEFQKAYEAGGDPAFLFNMGLCYRRANNAKAALAAYEKYLKSAPDSPQRPTVERRIQELEAQLHGQ